MLQAFLPLKDLFTGKELSITIKSIQVKSNLTLEEFKTKNLFLDEYLYVWACDFSNSRGEGLLARNFILNCSKHTKKYASTVLSNEQLFVLCRR